MEDLRKSVTEYFKMQFSHKKRLAFGIILATVLMVADFVFMKGGSRHDLVICLALSVLSGMLVVFECPFRKWLPYVTAVLFLAYVPRKMLWRMLLPLYDLSDFRVATITVNILIIVFVYAFFMLITQHINTGLGIGSIFWLIMTLANFYVTSFRGSDFTFNDLKAIGTAATVAGGYDYSFTPELWYSISYFVLFTVAGFWCRPALKEYSHGGKKVFHIVLTVLSAVYMAAFAVLFYHTDYCEKIDVKATYLYHGYGVEQWGLPLSFLETAHNFNMQKPEGYDEVDFDSISEGYSKDVETGVTPDIIFIMNESWADLSVLGEIETDVPVTPFMDSLTENVVKGYTYVNILGGLTCNSEFEALTGAELSFFPAGALPFSGGIKSGTASLASVLKEQGYSTVAMHPNGASSWNRDTVYPNLGFDDFISVTEFPNYETATYERGIMTDMSDFEALMTIYENASKPSFIFNVTFQNHGSYWGEVKEQVKVLSIEGEEPQETYVLETYLNLMKETDDALEALIGYFETVDRPVIICMFGDHQPFLADSDYADLLDGKGYSEEEIEKLEHITPYFIWTNYDSDLTDYGDISANYLGAVLLDAAGVEKSPFYNYILSLKESYPDISLYSDSISENDFSVYRALQYRLMQGNSAGSSLFGIE